MRLFYLVIIVILLHNQIIAAEDKDQLFFIWSVKQGEIAARSPWLNDEGKISYYSVYKREKRLEVLNADAFKVSLDKLFESATLESDFPFFSMSSLFIVGDGDSQYLIEVDEKNHQFQISKCSPEFEGVCSVVSEKRLVSNPSLLSPILNILRKKEKLHKKGKGAESDVIPK